MWVSLEMNLYLGKLEKYSNSPWTLFLFKTTAYVFDSIAVNGRANFGENQNVPLEIFEYRAGESLYLVSATADWSVYFSVGGHRMKVIELDGFPIDPKYMDILLLNPGETAR